MRAYKDFIVNIPEKFSETFTTESGLELYGSKEFSKKRMANSIVTVHQVPFENGTDIGIGDELFLDPSLFMEQIYSKGGEQENIYLMDKKKALFKVPTQLIIAYKKKEGQWIMFGDNALLERIREDGPGESESIIYTPSNQKEKQGTARLFLDIPELELKKGDTIYIDETYVNDIWLGQKPVMWLKQRHLLGLMLKEAI